LLGNSLIILIMMCSLTPMKLASISFPYGNELCKTFLISDPNLYYRKE
jgi:hypothetical protein